MNTSAEHEKLLIWRIRNAVQTCKAETPGLENFLADTKMEAPQRMAMEKCLVQNYLLKFGMDYFGKRDLIYLDMQGDKDVARLDSKISTPRVKPPKPVKEAAGGEDEGGEEEE